MEAVLTAAISKIETHDLPEILMEKARWSALGVRVVEVALDIGSCARLEWAAALNARGIRARCGKEWSVDNLEQFLSEHEAGFWA